MQLKFDRQEMENLILSAVRTEWPNMIGSNEDAHVSISTYDGVTVTITRKEETQ